jgi:thiol-disulfide isomerase/thioredoxin
MVRDSWKFSFAAALMALAWTGLLPVAAGAQEQDAAGEEQADAAPATGEPAVDIYAVPDGTPAELLAYIQKLLNSPPADGSPEGRLQHRDKQILLSIDAASKILASKDATPKEAAEGAEIKLQLLTIAIRLGLEGVETPLDEFKEALRKDERSLVRAVIVQRDLLEQSAQWRQLDEEGQKKYFDDFVGFLTSIELEPRHGQLVHMVGSTLDRQDQKAAQTLINLAVPIFAASEDENVASVAIRLERLLRYVRLVGSEMPIEGELLGGEAIDWSQFKDKVVLVDFWATWCGPCIAELPNVVENYKRYHGKGFEVVGISLDSDPLKVKDFVEQREIPWQILFSEDPEATGWEHPMAVLHGIDAIPAAILVGKDGKVITKEARGPELGSRLRELLGEPLPIPEDVEEDAVKTSQTESEESKE